MSEVIDFPSKIPQEVFRLARSHNLIVEPAGSDGNYFLRGQSFTTEKGVNIDPGYGYLKPTGKQRLVDKKEEIEVYCCRSGKKDFVPVSVLEPLRLIDDLEPW